MMKLLFVIASLLVSFSIAISQQSVKQPSPIGHYMNKERCGFHLLTMSFGGPCRDEQLTLFDDNTYSYFFSDHYCGNAESKGSGKFINNNDTILFLTNWLEDQKWVITKKGIQPIGSLKDKWLLKPKSNNRGLEHGISDGNY